jgi:hypothetical protein
MNSNENTVCKKLFHYSSEKNLVLMKKNLQLKEWKKICNLILADRVKFLSDEQQCALHMDQIYWNDFEFPIIESLIEVKKIFVV